MKDLTDGDLAKTTLLPPVKPGENAWIQYEFAKPETFSSLTIVGGGFAGTFGFGADPDNRTLEISDDGKNFRKIFSITRGGVEQKTMTFDPLTAKYFRLNWKTPPPQPQFNIGSLFGGGSRNRQAAPAGTQIAELVLHRVPRINRFEEKAAFATVSDLYKSKTPEANPEQTIRLPHPASVMM